MKGYSLNPSNWSLSKKITSMVLVILTIPIFSISLLQEIEKTLVEGVKDNLALSNKLIANQLSSNSEWFEQSLLPDTKDFIGEAFFVFPISSKLSLDGYFDEWLEHRGYRKEFTNARQKFSILLGYESDSFLFSAEVYDQSIVFPRLDGEGLSDSLEIEFRTESNQSTVLYLSPSGAGEFAVRTMKNGELRPDWRYKAFWLNTSLGFNLEIKFPSGIKPQEIRITHRDVDQHKQQSNGLLSTSRYGLNPLVWPSSKFSKFLDQLSLKPAQRIWILDKYGRVLATKGDLKTNELQFSRNKILNWILSSQSEIESDPRNGVLQIDSEATYSALKGNETTRVEYLKDSDNAIAVAASPILINSDIGGVLLLEENVAKVQVLQKKALLKIFILIILIFVSVVCIVFWYVNRTVRRIKKLNHAIEEVVDEQGRMRAPLKLVVKQGDEIDELYTAFSNMGERLYEYNDYLEKLAARLSHELRTPIAIVRSSLDNLALNCESPDDLEIINRALDGNKRLGEIISRMRQASGVKEAMQTAEKNTVEMVDFVRQSIDGFQSSFPQNLFQFKTDIEKFEMKVSVDLLSEMLDKLIANAMDFSPKTQPIEIGLSNSQGKLIIRVSNSGPTIAKKNLKRIFDSLISIRSKEQSSGTNLGLGLHIVRLIADFHGFSVIVKNRDDQSGVVFEIRC